jgi:transposase-like protein
MANPVLSLIFLDEVVELCNVGVSSKALEMLIEGTKMDWETLYCPNQRCRYYGIPFRQGKMVKNGTSYGQPQALCKGCRSSVALSYATAYYGLESDPAIFETAVRALAEGNSIRATGRILQIDKDGV